MNSDVVASVSLGAVALTALALIGLGVVSGGWIARVRSQRRWTRAAHDHARRIRDVLNALPLASLIADADAHVIAYNAGAAQLLKTFGQNGDLPLPVDAAVGRVIRSHVSETLELALPDEVAQRVQVVIAPVHADASSAEALVLFNDARANAGRVDVYRQLTGMLAHELRTPLTAIMGHVDILGSCRIDEEALWRRSLGFVAGEVDRLARLVEDLLNLSRLDRMPLHVQSINMRVVTEEALSELFEKAERNQVALVLQAPPELPRVSADTDRIRQVMLNLLDNAIKYAPGSTVTARLTPAGATLRVEVGDNGPGIPREDLPHIFEPMYRGARATGGAHGSGLGLTIVRTILDQHNAPIRVHSAPDQNTIFSFSLPLARPE